MVADAAENDGPIQVVDQDGNQYDATVVGRSPTYDLAVLFVEDGPDLPPASLGASLALNVGDPVVAFGSPLGLSSTVTAGIVSALNRPVSTGDSDNQSSYINAVQTDAAINPGNSGGPLVNLRGQVVGVNSAIATTGGAVQGEAGSIGVGFAIPVEQVKVTADQILRTGEARYPVIGAKVVTGGEGSGTGAEISEVLPDTPADQAGLEEGDVVTELDGTAGHRRDRADRGDPLAPARRGGRAPVDARRRGADPHGDAGLRGRLACRSDSGSVSAGSSASSNGCSSMKVSRLVVHPLDVGLELGRLDPPLAAAADLDGHQVAAPDQRVDLRARGVEHLGDVGQRQEARRRPCGHGVTPRDRDVRRPPRLWTGACGWTSPGRPVPA